MASALAMRMRKPSRDTSNIKCYTCDEFGHMIRDCPNPPGKNYRPRNNERYESGKAMAAAESNIGQWALSMRATTSSPSGWMWDEDYGIRCDVETGSGGDDTATHTVDLAGALNKVALSPTPFRWILDSGATHHITPDGEHLTNIRPLEAKMSFAIASGAHLTCFEKGDLPIRLKSGRQATLTDVHIVSGSDVNLLSARVLARKGWSVCLKGNAATISKESEQIALQDSNGLWTTHFEKSDGTAYVTDHRAAPPVTLQDEHERLGHIGRHKLLKLAHQNALRISHAEAVLDPFRLTACSTCQKMKIARKTLDGMSPHGSRNAELVHVDVSGPMDPSSSGFDHFVAILDDYSKTCAVVPMKGRKPAMGLLADFVTRLETQLGEKVRFIRSDNGPEFISQSAVEWYKSRGIIHQVSPRYRPELNGTIERFIRTIKEMIGSMLDDSGMGHGVWDLAAQYAAVILMKTSSARNGKSTWSQYTGRDVGINSIVKFGAPCFIHIPRQTRLKARLDEPKAVPGRVVGQADNISGWIVQVSSTGEIHRSRDVRIDTATLARAREAINTSEVYLNSTRVRRFVPPARQLPELPEQSTEDPASVFHKHQNCTAIFEEPDVIVADSQERPVDAVGESPVTRADDHEGSDTTRAASSLPALSEPSLRDPPRSHPGRQTVSKQRIRPSASWELVPERRIDNVTLPPASFTTLDGRRIMTRRVPGRSRLAVRDAVNELEGDEDPDLAEEGDVDHALAIGWTLSTMVDDDEPQSVSEALQGPNASQWQAAIDAELDNLVSKGTWIEVEKPTDRKTVGCSWILKVKRDAMGDIVKFKARLVAQGFSQVPGVDFEETYAPVGRTASLRIMLAIAAFMDLDIQQADVEGAYLNGTLDIDIYMRYPEGVERSAGCDALKLNKALYGLKQSGRLWWQELGSKLAGLGFSKLHSDWGLYVRAGTGDRDFMMLLVYVDDFIMAAKNTEEISKFLLEVQKHWKLSEMGEIDNILGMKVIRDRSARKIHLTQPAYIDKIAKQFPTTSNPRFRCSTPLPDGYGDIHDSKMAETTPFQGLVGCFQWLASCTRPDISYAASFLARHLTSPTEHHMQLARRAAAYLKHTRNYALTIGGGNDLVLRGFVDADWAGCIETRRSTSGYVFQLNETAVVWSSKRQPTVACSTVEAEYVATSEAAREAMWLRQLLEEIGIRQTGPTLINCDNKGAIRLALNPGTHQRTKHIDIKHHFIRELVEQNIISVEYVQSKRQLADIFTKGLPRPRHLENSGELGLRRIEE